MQVPVPEPSFALALVFGVLALVDRDAEEALEGLVQGVGAAGVGTRSRTRQAGESKAYQESAPRFRHENPACPDRVEGVSVDVVAGVREVRVGIVVGRSGRTEGTSKTDVTQIRATKVRTVNIQRHGCTTRTLAK